MTPDTPASRLRTCPDCGGILEPIEPAYFASIEADAAASGARSEPTGWRCLLCGYREATEPCLHETPVGA